MTPIIYRRKHLQELKGLGNTSTHLGALWGVILWCPPLVPAVHQSFVSSQQNDHGVVRLLNLLVIGDSGVFNFFLSGDLGVQRVPVQPAALEKSSRYFGRRVPGKGAAPSTQQKFP